MIPKGFGNKRIECRRHIDIIIDVFPIGHPNIDQLSTQYRWSVDSSSILYRHTGLISTLCRYTVDTTSILCRYSTRYVDTLSIFRRYTNRIPTKYRPYVDTSSILCRYHVDIRPRMSTSLCCMESALQMIVLERCLNRAIIVAVIVLERFLR